MPILEVQGLTYEYGQGNLKTLAVDDVSLQIEAGSCSAIIGHTGSGKSTLIQHFNGLFEPTSGKVLYDGKNIWEDKTNIRNVRFQVGLCFQYPEYQLFEETVYKDIAYGPKNKGLNEDEVDAAVKRAAAYMGLKKGYLKKSPFDLSGGEKRRVAIAGILAMEPKVLVLDEPTAGLDPRGRDAVFDIIKNYQAATGNTVILVSHSMEDVAKLAQQVFVMNRGKIAMQGPVEEVFSHAEELVEMHLNVPQITQVFTKLKQKGYPVNANIYRVDQALAEVKRLLGEGASR